MLSVCLIVAAKTEWGSTGKNREFLQLSNHLEKNEEPVLLQRRILNMSLQEKCWKMILLHPCLLIGSTFKSLSVKTN